MKLDKADLATAIAGGQVGNVYLSPLAVTTATTPDVLLRQRPGQAARSQLEVLPRPTPGRSIPTLAVTLPEFQAPRRVRDASERVVSGGVLQLRRWVGATEGAEVRRLLDQAKVAAIRGSQGTGIEWYKAWQWGPHGYHGTLKVGP